MPNPVMAPGVRQNDLAKGVSTAATGAVLTYTAPANRRAEVTACWSDELNAAVAASPELVDGANAFRPFSTVAAGTRVGGAGVTNPFPRMGIMLEAGQVFRWNVTTALAATTADFVICTIEEA